MFKNRISIQKKEHCKKRKNLLTSRGLSHNIRNAGLSNEAINLYEIMFGVDISNIYDIQYNTITNVFSESSLSPYLLYKNRKILRDLFTIIMEMEIQIISNH